MTTDIERLADELADLAKLQPYTSEPLCSLDAETLKEAAAALRRLAEMERGWQPIETHPRDNSQFLVTDGSSVIVAEGHPPGLGMEIFDCTSCGFGKATHWMPLPPPPAAS